MISSQTIRDIQVHDLHPAPGDFLRDVQGGLSKAQKRLPSMYFYDQTGSELFDRICELDEYYPTRTELSILRDNASELSECVGERCMLIELGSGSSEKTRILLRQLDNLHSYVPLDISKEHLSVAAQAIASTFPGLAVLPVCADFMSDLSLPRVAAPPRKKLVFFPGSTIGNFNPEQRQELLTRIRRLCRLSGGLLIGVDLVKDKGQLERAYNDASGVTAAFNINLLHRINRELGADFDVQAFRHEARYNDEHTRIEMHLVAECAQQARVGGRKFDFARGESICTEYSYKFTLDGFRDEARAAGFHTARIWTDAERLFAVVLLTSADSLMS